MKPTPASAEEAKYLSRNLTKGMQDMPDPIPVREKTLKMQIIMQDCHKMKIEGKTKFDYY